MFLFQIANSNWFCIPLLAIAIKILISFHTPTEHQEDPEVESALRRAKTIACKKELREFASHPIHEVIPSYLRRSCELDSTSSIHHRNLVVGCATDSSSGIVKLEDTIATLSLCLDTCFSYGHSFGGFSNGSCFCGDDDLKPRSQTRDCNSAIEFNWYRVDNGIHKPLHSSSRPAEAKPIATNVNIAFLLILSGRASLQIRRLFESIYSEKHIYYLHVDERHDYLMRELSSLENRHTNVIITRSRFRTVWGSPSLLWMIIDAICHLTNHKWEYLVNLSESDFPLKPLWMLETYLASAGDTIYLKSHNIKGYKFIKKQGLDRNFYQCEDRVWRVGRRQLPRGIVYSGGSDWFALPRAFCNYIDSNLANPDALVRPLLQLYNYTLLPAESFFHTLALNSEFCDRFANHNLRITNWNRKKSCKCQHSEIVDWCGCSPLVYRWSDWSRLRLTNSSTDLFFSRKFDPTISSSVILAVERELLGRKTNHDSSFWVSIYDDKDAGPAPDYLQQFGSFAVDQGQTISISSPERLSELKSVVLYFNHDRFIGIVFEHCDGAKCAQLLVESNNTAHLRSYNSKCFAPNKRELRLIEVNHGFDIGERMFRRHEPMHSMSNIVVYHEWLVESANESTDVRESGDNKFQYSWWNPSGKLELTQNVKLKGAPKPTKLSLAHRLTITQPLESGIWTLSITRGNMGCLAYEFPVFGPSSYDENKISSLQFNKFYHTSRFY